MDHPPQAHGAAAREGVAAWQVASGDEGGTICLWDLTTGRQEGHFNDAHGSAKLVRTASTPPAAPVVGALLPVEWTGV